MSGTGFDERGPLTAFRAVSSLAHCRAKTASAVSPGQASPLVRQLPAAGLFAALERETRAAIERMQHVLD
ncbi:hypothetical protein [Burkholderia cepacia]|uniref:hypothetical protein n=1 Tax=Burkholderia cepacia TaxID=292 RepID=UPI0009C0248C|nr:hypothetical protein [Burkholderia cepacia]